MKIIDEDLLDELNFYVQQASAVAKELREARSLLGFSAEIRDMAAILKIISHVMLNDDETREEIKETAKKTKDANILDFVEKFERSKK